MRWSVEGRTQAGFGVALVLLVFVGVVSFRSTQGLIGAMQWVTHTHIVIEKLERTLADINAIESDGRGFVITGDERLIASSGAALAELRGAQAQLRKLTADNPHQQRSLDALEPLLAAKLAFSRGLVETRRLTGSAAAIVMIQSGLGRSLMANLERLIGNMEREERTLLRERAAQTAAGARLALVLILLGSVLAWVVVGLGLMMFRHDMSRLRRAEAAVQESQSRLQAILDNTTTLIYVKDIESRYLIVNHQVESMLGRNGAELLGKSPFDLFEKTIADDIRAHDVAILASPGPMTLEEVAPMHGEPRTFVSVKCALRGADGIAYAMCGVSTDITERKRDEERSAALNASLECRTAELVTANQELEAFSYSVSHDLRAPLRHIAGFGEMLQRRVGPALDPVSGRYLDTMRQAATQMGVLIDNLLMFSLMGRSHVNHTRVHLGTIVAQVVNDMENELQGRVIEWHIAPLPEVDGDPAMLKLALVNLISNAVKYTRTRPNARIEIGTETRDHDNVVFVRDNGVGFEPEYTHKLFGVFQRLHRSEEFEGTGIGLANVRRIVHRHGGSTWAEGQVDRGAAFYFSIPKVQEAA